ncbi:hypothetical protein PES01_34950 [Pseudoalteromonas espejiana]|uniref:Uncharacterized protein n=1 Tax=Pseudoalteromonas espejiana TaxID=28107 RepID=A0A510Y037_9GAMM|nr:hypothetical protein PES01_34950 [Pseudoalteromonas espejiana]
MIYAFQVKKLSTLIQYFAVNSQDELNELLKMPTSDLKRDTYTVFHEVFENISPHRCQAKQSY